MSYGTLNSRLGEVRCQHRWETGPEFPYPYPRTPSLAQDEDEGGSLGTETGWCRRCGMARLRLFDRERDFAVSSWSHVASWEHLILGRPLDEFENRKTLANMVLN